MAETTKTQEFLNTLATRESNARSYSRKLPVALKSADGCWFTDMEGKKILDCLANAGTLAMGHNHPIIRDEMQKFLDEKRPFQTLDLATEVKDDFINTLFSALPADKRAHTRVQFCNAAGTDSVEGAIKLCKVATGRSNVICFQGAYHGQSNGSMSLLGSLGAKEKIPNLMPGVHHFPYPYMYRPPFGIEGEAGVDALIYYLEWVLSDPESGITKPACVIIECIQGEGGHIPAPPRFLQALRRITREHDIPLICDEIQSGWCRSGRLFAFEYAEIWPDVITISKAVGGGMPLACILFDEKLNTWAPGTHAGTFRGNQLGMALGSRQIKFMLETKMWEEVYEKGEYFRTKARAIPSKTIGDVRGLGLMNGIEVVDPKKPKDKIGRYPFNGALAALVQKECIANGLMIEKGGRDASVLRFLPPLIITKEELDIALDIFSKAILKVEAELGY